MDDGPPWIYVAMVFIAFLSWVRSRMQEASAARRERAAAKKALQHARNSASPVVIPSPYRPAPIPAPASKPTHPNPPSTFRELFETLLENSTPTQTLSPPPIPAPHSGSDLTPPLSDDRDRSSGSRDQTALPPFQPIHVEKIGRKTSYNLNRIIKNRGTLREAIILKEILDTPLSMRE